MESHDPAQCETGGNDKRERTRADIDNLAQNLFQFEEAAEGIQHQSPAKQIQLSDELERPGQGVTSYAPRRDG
jgi:hypothetical protein